MHWGTFLRVGLAAGIATCVLGYEAPMSAAEGGPDATSSAPLTNYLGRITNAPAIFKLYSYPLQSRTRNLYYSTNALSLATNRLPPAALKHLLELRRYEFHTNFIQVTNSVFEGFVAGSLNYLVWTNFIAHTNGRDVALWSVRTHPQGWPTDAPRVKWNPRSILWGAKGLTGLSPCWEQEGLSGQVPITAITRRHGYTRGHGMGPDGFRTHYAGKKVWFVTTNDTLVQMTIAREVVRTASSGIGDYCLVLFDRDLPDSIQPLRVVASAELEAKLKSCPGAPRPVIGTEQGGTIGAGAPGFAPPGHKPGDSGSPNMVLMPGELVFHSGRTTSGPSAEMQADMDALCKMQGLNPARYRLQWFDLSAYPSY